MFDPTSFPASPCRMRDGYSATMCRTQKFGSTKTACWYCSDAALLPRFAQLARYRVELRGHDEVVLVQALDLLGPQRDRRVPPAEGDVRMVPLRFGQFSGTRHKGEC